jgi:hypothetical protein
VRSTQFRAQEDIVKSFMKTKHLYQAKRTQKAEEQSPLYLPFMAANYEAAVNGIGGRRHAGNSSGVVRRKPCRPEAY